jgi:hypothetical protein
MQRFHVADAGSFGQLLKGEAEIHLKRNIRQRQPGVEPLPWRMAVKWTPPTIKSLCRGHSDYSLIASAGNAEFISSEMQSLQRHIVKSRTWNWSRKPFHAIPGDY